MKKNDSVNKFFAQNNGGNALTPVKKAADPVLEKLHQHLTEVDKRLNAAKFADNILSYEEREWTKLHDEAVKKLAKVKESNKPAVERLIQISDITAAKYRNRGTELPDTIATLEEAQDKLRTAIHTLEAEQQLQEVTSMFDIHTFEAKKFDIDEQSREIKTLLHTTDALLEITAK